MTNYALVFCFATGIPKAFVTMVASLSVFCIPPPWPASCPPTISWTWARETASQILVWEAVKTTGA